MTHSFPSRRSSDLAYGNDADKIFVGIIAGAEVGLAPFQALQSIAVIGNNPAIWGDDSDGLECLERRKRSEEHTSELQSLMRTSYAVLCLKKKTTKPIKTAHIEYKHKTKHQQ